ncbi:MAG: hypothetical protein WC152_07040, partial [Candidatus Izemoplasmatales bacterium]
VGSSSQDIRLFSSIDVLGVEVKPSVSLKYIPSYASGNIKNVDVQEFSKILGRDAPKSTYTFYKKRRMIIDYNTTVEQLRYSKRFIGRAFSGSVRISVFLLKKLGMRSSANFLSMGIVHLPMRGLAHMSGGAISWGQLDGLIMMFNGHFFKGFSKYLKERKLVKKEKRIKKQSIN